MKVKDFILDGFAVSLVAYLNNEYKAEGQFRMSGDSNKMKYFYNISSYTWSFY